MVYGWEKDLQTIWMNYFNKKLLREGLITKEEYIAMERRIHPPKLLNDEEFRGRMSMS